ncbi:MAG: MTH1187 family thiamine-binding protein [Melioribacteraceae bacterium]|nr:MTH1187 family thiamine-binding protein [Melioribacteraceae bacterium]
MVLLEFAMSPFDKGESLSENVAKIIKFIDESGITYKLTPMGTILEGNWDDVIDVVSGCFRIMEKDCNRISLNLKMDYRKGEESRLESKIKKVESLIGKKLRK